MDDLVSKMSEITNEQICLELRDIVLKRMELILSKNNEYCNGNKDHVFVLGSIITFLTEMIQNPKDTNTFSLHEITSTLFSPSTSWGKVVDSTALPSSYI